MNIDFFQECLFLGSAVYVCVLVCNHVVLSACAKTARVSCLHYTTHFLEVLVSNQEVSCLHQSDLLCSTRIWTHTTPVCLKCSAHFRHFSPSSESYCVLQPFVLAFMMGTHSRLGAGSPVLLLDDLMAASIAQSIIPDSW